VEVGLLGPLRVVDDQGRVVVVAAAKQRVVLACLALRVGELVTTDELAEAIWGGRLPANPRRTVQTYVTRLRKLLGGGVVQGRPQGYALAVGSQAVDVGRFGALVARARAAGAVGDRRTEAVVLGRALLLWRGEPLADVPVEGPLGEVVVGLGEQRLAVVEQRVAAELALGRHGELVAELRELCERYPLREGLWAQLLVALYRCGRQADALAAYRRVRGLLAEELGIDPGPGLQRLHQAILTSDPALQAGGIPGPAPTPPAPASVRPSPCQLPADIVDLTGREKAVATLVDLLGRGGHPDRSATIVAAIVGPPGVGKTTLAVHVAHRLRSQFPDGQLYVNLRGAEARPLDSYDVLLQFLTAMGVNGDVVPEDADERAGLYRSLLADRRVLVVLDNATDEAQVRPLLPGSPGCAVIVTSRAPLGVIPAHTLALDVLTPGQAVELLAAILGQNRVAAEPAAARSIVDLCSGLPLALRIAGAKLATKPHWRLAKLAGRLGDERRRLDELRAGDLEVRASFALSYQSRSEDERRLFRLLGLLQSPDFSAWAAAALLDAPTAVAEELLERLVEAQLLQAAGDDGAGPDRYRFHDLLRVFARAHLEEESAQAQRAALERVLGAQLALAREACSARWPVEASEVLPGGATRWLPDHASIHAAADNPIGWFQAELPGLLAGVRQACEAGLDEVAWELACVLTSPLMDRCDWRSWRSTLELALAACHRAGNRFGAAQVLRSLGEFYLQTERYERAVASYDKSRTTFRDLGEQSGEALALMGLGFSFTKCGDLDQAATCFDRCLAHFEAAGRQHGIAVTVRGLADVHRLAGRLDQAANCYQRCLELFVGLAVPDHEAAALLAYARLHQDRGQLDEAAACYRRCLATFQDLANQRWVAMTHRRLAELHLLIGEPGKAAAYLDKCIPMFRELHLRAEEARSLENLGSALAMRGGQVAAQRAWQGAYAIFQELGMPEASSVRGRLTLAHSS
jgi:DNA-binding SARP family transcriptional activator/tetratricopeptide (TPR) repeat protein